MRKGALMIVWVRNNILLFSISFLYVLCTAYVITQLLDTYRILGFSDVDLADVSARELETLSLVLFLMCATGFGMMVLLGGNIINLGRMGRERLIALQKSKGQMRAIELAGEGIAIFDAEGKYTYVNTAHARLCGFDDKAEMIGMHWQELCTPRQIARFEGEVYPALQRQGVWNGQGTARRRDGSEFVAEISLTLLDDGGMVATVRDMTEKMKSERLLRIIKLSVEAAADGIAITDEENRLLFMNRSFLKIHGYDPYDREKYIGTDWRLLYNAVGQELINGTVLPTTILKGTWSGSLSVMRKDSALFYGDASLTRLPDGLILGVMRDVTDRRRAELEREALRDQLFQSQKIEAIGRLTQRLVTDFQDIVAAVSRCALSLRKDGLGEVERKDCAAEIAHEAAKAEEVIEQLLAFSRSKTVKSGAIDIKPVVSEVCEGLRGAMPGNVIFLSEVRARDASVHFYPGQVEQIIKNLVANGVDALGRRSGKVTLVVRDMDWNLCGLRRYMMREHSADRLKASAMRTKAWQGKNYLMAGFLAKERNYLQLTVSDTGGGIFPDILPHIFDPFFTTKNMNNSTGLGLSTIQTNVINAGGALIVETVPEQGTSVHVFLPHAALPERDAPGLAA